MKLETFFEKFELFAEAPGAAERIRYLLINFAVTGKLVPNDPDEKSVGLKLSGSTDDSPLPNNWRAGIVGDVFTFEYGENLPAPKRSQSGEYPVFGSNGVVGTHDRFLTKDPAIIVGRKGSAGALNISAGPSWTTDVAYFVRPPQYLDLRFSYYLFLTLKLDDLGKGIKPGLSRKQVYALPIRIPPLAEQKRIVAKVDELMALCDQLELQQRGREAHRDKLAHASLARFAEAPTPANLVSLFDSPYDITPADLRKSILTLSVQGKLIPFDTNGKEQTVADHIEFQNGYAFKSEWFKPSGVRLCRNANVSHGILDWHASACVDEKIAKAFKKFALNENDIVLSLDRPLIATGLKVARVRKIDLPCLLLQRVAKPVPKHDQLDLSYFMLWLNSSEFVDSIDPGRSNGVPHISTKQIERLPLVLPPLAEQRRIVAKVDELMALVDQLESQLGRAKADSTTLLDAAIHELLNPREQAAVDRSGIGCHVVHRLADRKTFGRTALAKFAYLAETHVGLEFNGQYLREAAGPLDPWIYRFEEEAAREHWFTFEGTSIHDGNRKIVYRKGEALEAKASEAVAALPKAQREELDRILKLLGGKPTEEIEIIATLFAVWNDFLIDGHSPSDEDIVTGFREQWHEKKQKFMAKSLHVWLDWMRRNDLVPTGRGPRTRQHAKLDLH